MNLLRALAFSMATFASSSIQAGSCVNSKPTILFLRDSFVSPVNITGLIPNSQEVIIRAKQACLTTLNFENDLIAYFPASNECAAVSGSQISILNRMIGEEAAYTLLTRSNRIISELQYGSALIYQSENPLGTESSSGEQNALANCPQNGELIFRSGFES